MGFKLIDPNPAVPPIVAESYAELYDLCQNHSKDGRVSAINTADLLGISYESFRNLVFTGQVPFAFGSNKMMGRGVSCIHVLPLFQFMTQGTIFRPVADREIVQRITEA